MFVSSGPTTPALHTPEEGKYKQLFRKPIRSGDTKVCCAGARMSPCGFRTFLVEPSTTTFISQTIIAKNDYTQKTENIIFSV